MGKKDMKEPKLTPEWEYMKWHIEKTHKEEFEKRAKEALKTDGRRRKTQQNGRGTLNISR